jgi:hypothetical protein
MQQKILLINSVQKYTQIICTVNKLIKRHWNQFNHINHIKGFEKSKTQFPPCSKHLSHIDALTTSRFILTLLTQTTWIEIWLLFDFLKTRNDKITDEISSHYSRLQNYISTCHSNNFHIDVHPNFYPFSHEPTIEPSPFWKIHYPHLSQHHLTFFPSRQKKGQDHVA